MAQIPRPCRDARSPNLSSKFVDPPVVSAPLGVCSVLHAMQLAGITGSYGRRLRAAVIGFGGTARGAVTALNAHGVDDVRALTYPMIDPAEMRRTNRQATLVRLARVRQDSQ
jgi:hypothetical protein